VLYLANNKRWVLAIIPKPLADESGIVSVNELSVRVDYEDLVYKKQ
jgi:hypothetical protein